MYQIRSKLNARSDSLQQLREATKVDDTLAFLKYTIHQGWPDSIKDLPSEIQPFWTFQEEPTIEDGLILKGTRIVIPSKKQDEILQLIHEGHLGLTKCKLQVKETVYWPGLNEQLEKYLILNCPLCLKYSQSKCKQPSHIIGTGLTSSTLRENHTYCLWTTQAASQLCTNCIL